MSDESLLTDLLLSWEEAVRAGREPRPEELARDRPDLVPELRRRIDELRQVDGLLATVHTAPPTPTPPEVSRPAGRYRPLRYHARGGLGEVYLARDEELKRDVALKRMQPRFAHDARTRERFLREAEITGRLQHPGVVPVYGLEERDGQPCYTMRFIEGESFHAALDRHRAQRRQEKDANAARLRLRQLLTRFVSVCNTLAYAHNRAVIHRDIKPGNIMLGAFGETLVIDWGLARVLEAGEETTPLADAEPSPEAHLTAPGGVVGTPGYMSPEQAQGRGEAVGPASDVFSLGATLYAVLTGRAPYVGPEALRAAQDGTFPAPRAVNPEVPPALEAVCLAAMAPEPARRYPSALALAADVDRWLADEPVSVHRESGAERLGRWARRHRTLVTSTALLLVAAVVGLVVAALLLGAANRRTTDALSKARSNSQRARRALNTFYLRVSEENLLNAPRMKPFRKELLGLAKADYEEFLKEEGDNPALRADAGRAAFYLARIVAEIDSTERALVEGQRALALLEPLATADDADPDVVTTTAECLQRLSNWHLKANRHGEAEKALMRAEELLEPVRHRFPDHSACRLALANTHMGFGPVYESQGLYDRARQRYLRALELGEALRQAGPDDPAPRFLVATLRIYLGNHGQRIGELRDTEENYREGARLLEALEELPAHQAAARANLFEVRNNLAELYWRTNRPAEALPWADASLATAQRLAADHPEDFRFQRFVGQGHGNRGKILRDLDREAEAEAAFQKAVDVLEPLVAKDRGDLDHRVSLAKNYGNFGALYSGRTPRPERATALFDKAEAIWQELRAAHPEVPDYGVSLARIYQNRARLATNASLDLKAARDFESRATALLRDLVRQFPKHSGARETLALTLAGLATTEAVQGRGGAALALWDEALQYDDGRYRLEFRAKRAYTLALLGDHARAAAEADGLAGDPALPVLWLSLLPSVYTTSAYHAGRDDKRPLEERKQIVESYHGRAIAVLRRLQDGGFHKDPINLRHLQTNPALGPLRGRDDFKTLLAEAEGPRELLAAPAEAR